MSADAGALVATAAVPSHAGAATARDLASFEAEWERRRAELATERERSLDAAIVAARRFDIAPDSDSGPETADQTALVDARMSWAPPSPFQMGMLRQQYQEAVLAAERNLRELDAYRKQLEQAPAEWRLGPQDQAQVQALIRRIDVERADAQRGLAYLRRLVSATDQRIRDAGFSPAMVVGAAVTQRAERGEDDPLFSGVRMQLSNERDPMAIQRYMDDSTQAVRIWMHGLLRLQRKWNALDRKIGAERSRRDGPDPDRLAALNQDLQAVAARGGAMRDQIDVLFLQIAVAKRALQRNISTEEASNTITREARQRIVQQMRRGAADEAEFREHRADLARIWGQLDADDREARRQQQQGGLGPVGDPLPAQVKWLSDRGVDKNRAKLAAARGELARVKAELNRLQTVTLVPDPRDPRDPRGSARMAAIKDARRRLEMPPRVRTLQERQRELEAKIAFREGALRSAGVAEVDIQEMGASVLAVIGAKTREERERIFDVARLKCTELKSDDERRKREMGKLDALHKQTKAGRARVPASDPVRREKYDDLLKDINKRIARLRKELVDSQRGRGHLVGKHGLAVCQGELDTPPAITAEAAVVVSTTPPSDAVTVGAPMMEGDDDPGADPVAVLTERLRAELAELRETMKTQALYIAFLGAEIQLLPRYATIVGGGFSPAQVAAVIQRYEKDRDKALDEMQEMIDDNALLRKAIRLGVPKDQVQLGRSAKDLEWETASREATDFMTKALRTELTKRRLRPVPRSVVLLPRSPTSTIGLPALKLRKRLSRGKAKEGLEGFAAREAGEISAEQRRIKDLNAQIRKLRAEITKARRRITALRRQQSQAKRLARQTGQLQVSTAPLPSRAADWVRSLVAGADALGHPAHVASPSVADQREHTEDAAWHLGSLLLGVGRPAPPPPPQQTVQYYGNDVMMLPYGDDDVSGEDVDTEPETDAEDDDTWSDMYVSSWFDVVRPRSGPTACPVLAQLGVSAADSRSILDHEAETMAQAFVKHHGPQVEAAWRAVHREATELAAATVLRHQIVPGQDSVAAAVTLEGHALAAGERLGAAVEALVALRPVGGFFSKMAGSTQSSGDNPLPAGAWVPEYEGRLPGLRAQLAQVNARIREIDDLRQQLREIDPSRDISPELLDTYMGLWSEREMLRMDLDHGMHMAIRQGEEDRGQLERLHLGGDDEDQGPSSGARVTGPRGNLETLLVDRADNEAELRRLQAQMAEVRRARRTDVALERRIRYLQDNIAYINEQIQDQQALLYTLTGGRGGNDEVAVGDRVPIATDTEATLPIGAPTLGQLRAMSRLRNSSLALYETQLARYEHVPAELDPAAPNYTTARQHFSALAALKRQHIAELRAELAEISEEMRQIPTHYVSQAALPNTDTALAESYGGDLWRRVRGRGRRSGRRGGAIVDPFEEPRMHLFRLQHQAVARGDWDLAARYMRQLDALGGATPEMSIRLAKESQAALPAGAVFPVEYDRAFGRYQAMRQARQRLVHEYETQPDATERDAIYQNIARLDRHLDAARRNLTAFRDTDPESELPDPDA